ncbi:hypothetical protein F2Q70_00025443 [Brassica cretica]|uniref:F-box domain-containing protein n=1 Tax=Brassica cretica TaxID=69181 RepID=A0A8S9L7Z2_BRACR|nr:hypothetical protein F2Q70_00025443 [Brassica cretica]
MSSKTRADNEESSEPLSPITSLPDDIVVDILARVPRHDYPTLSLVSKQFRSLVTSNEIYVRRSLLRKPTATAAWSISLLFWICLPVTALSRLHTVQPLPNMPIPMAYTVAGVLDGKVYVFGHCSMKSEVIVVFNTETQMWEPRMIKSDIITRYDPKERHRGVVKGLDELLAEISRLIYWKCTVRCGRNLALYFRKRAEEQSTETTRKIWCAEISLGRRQGGDIWGKVEWCDHVLTVGKFFYMKSLGAKCLDEFTFH